MKTDPRRPARSLALLSGGLDSTVALAIAAAEGPPPAIALFLDYGQHAARREEAAARRVAARYGCRFERVALPWLGAVSRSSLVAGRGAPRWRAARLDDDAPRSVWVENRNGLFVDVAAIHAAARRCGVVIVGFNREEARAFPDNSAAYLARLNRALELGARFPVRVESPTLRLTKRGIARRGIELDIPWERIWSCYRGGERMCGVCESCLRLRRAVAGTAAEGRLRFGKG